MVFHYLNNITELKNDPYSSGEKLALEKCDGPCNDSDASLILSDCTGLYVIVYISSGGVDLHYFCGIESLPQTYMTWLACVFRKELNIYEMIS